VEYFVNKRYAQDVSTTATTSPAQHDVVREQLRMTGCIARVDYVNVRHLERDSSALLLRAALRRNGDDILK
jgi:hypothetical protein